MSTARERCASARREQEGRVQQQYAAPASNAY